MSDGAFNIRWSGEKAADAQTVGQILSRMALKRCSHCCKELGIPQGDGAPGNVEDFAEPGCEEPEPA